MSIGIHVYGMLFGCCILDCRGQCSANLEGICHCFKLDFTSYTKVLSSLYRFSFAHRGGRSSLDTDNYSAAQTRLPTLQVRPPCSATWLTRYSSPRSHGAVLEGCSFSLSRSFYQSCRTYLLLHSCFWLSLGMLRADDR